MNKRIRKKGFGVLEVLLASIIIIIVVGALIFLARNTLNNSVYLQEKAQATFLAQEGIEIARQIRDTNYIDGIDETKWNTFTIDGSGSPRIPGNSDIDYYISFNSSNSKYEIRSGVVPTIQIDNINFTRTIKFYSNLGGLLAKENNAGNLVIDEDLQANAMLIEIIVNWESSFREGEVVLKELLTNSHQGM